MQTGVLAASYGRQDDEVQEAQELFCHGCIQGMMYQSEPTAQGKGIIDQMADNKTTFSTSDVARNSGRTV